MEDQAQDMTFDTFQAVIAASQFAESPPESKADEAEIQRKLIRTLIRVSALASAMALPMSSLAAAALLHVRLDNVRRLP